MDWAEQLEHVIENVSPQTLSAYFQAASPRFRPGRQDWLSAMKDDQDLLESLLQLGEIEFPDGQVLAVLAGKIHGEQSSRRSRTAQYEVTRQIACKENWADAGIFVFYDDAGRFRFGLVTTAYKGRKREFSSWRRYSYFVDPDESARTFIERVGGCDFSSIDIIGEAFSVEAVTREFYRDYAKVFSAVEARIEEGNGIGKQDLRMYTQMLFNRLMFLRFIEKKGWLKFEGQSHNYLARLCQARGSNGESFFRSRIIPLFFEGLADQDHGVSPAIIGEVPFLNGGLFEWNDHLDGLVEDIADDVFAAILAQPTEGDPGGLFYRYNFTVEESTPLDIEVAVDPEMLGKVFEELVTGRHQSGSYYTPRPIVAFMCREALKAYLGEKTSAPLKAVEALVDEHTVPPDSLTSQQAGEILFCVRTLKACDPACGSGAYLLGLMQELIAIRRALQNQAIKQDAQSLHEIKLKIISENLYGVDIDEFATNIAKLRLWLSLAVEGDNPVPLPNLDFKIETGDSLLGPCRETGQKSFGMFTLEQDARALAAKKHEYLMAHGPGKEGLAKWIHDRQGHIASELHAAYGPGVITWPVHFAEVFFADPERQEITFKGEFGFMADIFEQKAFKQAVETKTGGFDIVLANPPYGLVNKRQNQLMGYVLSKGEQNSFRSSAEYGPVLFGMINVFQLFIQRSLTLLCDDGIFAEIFPLSFAADQSCHKLRRQILNNQIIRRFEAFPERDDENRRVFRSAKMSVCILVAQKRCPAEDNSFPLRIHWCPAVEPDVPLTYLSPTDISDLDPEYLSVPLIQHDDLSRLRTLYSNSIHLSEIAKCYTGEVDLTIDRDFIVSDTACATLHKGAIIDRYMLRTQMSQGEIEFLDADGFTGARGQRPSSKAWHHREARIILQGITGINESVRLKMTYIPEGAFCANSANYIRMHDGDCSNMLYVLGVLNSEIANYVFRCFSTNSNVNGYEVDNLPIPNASSEDKKAIMELVQKCLNANGVGCETWEDEINRLVARLYGLGPEE